MAAGPNFCFPNVYDDAALSASLESTTNGLESQSSTSDLVYNLSLLKAKVQQVQLLAVKFISQSQTQIRAFESTPVNMDNIGGLLQEIIIVASSMMFTCQNIALSAQANANVLEFDKLSQPHNDETDSIFEWGGGGNSFHSTDYNKNFENRTQQDHVQVQRNRHKKSADPDKTTESERLSPTNYDIVEMDAADLLAKYTHYCQVCGKGFKRDANLRMHMRAHGDEYKSPAALANPTKHDTNPNTLALRKKYSCPQEGCRWNRKHEKFQPLKSMICMKNHYRRSHCPKMYACERCKLKVFSVVSDLRTHEKHCGDVKWQCSCGTTFSRKDKLMGHVGLFVGHVPVTVTSGNCLIENG